MRRKILHPGATELSYEIREIVTIGEKFEDLGMEVCWENIGDPIQKGVNPPDWMKKIASDLTMDPKSYAYCPSKGMLKTREFLAEKTNAMGGVQITSENILFCNGLGDAISKLYEYLNAGARVIGPSPAYSTHSSAEGSHASQPPLTYQLDPENAWLPNMEDLANKIKYNPNIVGVLIINPDNPTGMVYPKEYLHKIVGLAKEYQLFIVADEIYAHITYNGVHSYQLCEVIDDVCGVSMKGISKELPWPGSRCGWMEFYNTDRDPEFAGLVKAVQDAKMLEVSSTTLPQMAIPAIINHPEYPAYRNGLNNEIQQRGEVILEALNGIPEIIINRTYGAFYQTIVFRDGVLKPNQKLKIENNRARELVEGLVEGIALDKRFVYYLLAAEGICVVPISSFCSDLLGFRVTLLETDLQKMRWVYEKLRAAIKEYVSSS
jgi:aspartate/methionine/tyrosine aminotransferase